MRRFLGSERSIPLLLALLTLLGYGLLAGSAGFHWDDWGFAWARRFLGPAQFVASFAGYRPFLGPIFFLTTSLIPPVPLYWQLFALVIRFFIGLSAWWSFRTIWPERRLFALSLALFILIYPGYSQHWAALTHINQELIPFILLLLSFGATALAVRRRSPALTVLALLLQFGGLFPTEYFFGLEPLRFLFIASMLEGSLLERVRAALLRWLPYLALWLVDGVWLLSLYRSEAYISYGVVPGSGLGPASTLAGLGEALLKVGFIAWVQIIALAGAALPSPTSLLTLGLVALVFSLLWLAQPLLPGSVRDRGWAIFSILAGLAGILLGRLPSLAAGLPLTLQSVFDRFTISMALGAALLAAGLVELIAGGRPRLQWALISLLVGLGVGQQFFNANIFRRDWARQQEIFQQLAWRIPALEPGTLILTDVIPGLPLETDLSFTAPVNWMYAPDYRGGDLPFALLYTEARLGGGAIPELKPHQQVNLPFRTVTFHGSTDAALVILFPEQGCLRVMDPALGDAETYEKESPFLTQAIPLSDPARILTEAPALKLPSPPFVPAAQADWCSYYEQAELARQRGAWETILQLQKEAAAQGAEPGEALEWLPFIEAQARLGSLEQAVDLSRQAVRALPRAKKGVCVVWERVEREVPSRADAAGGLITELACIR